MCVQVLRKEISMYQARPVRKEEVEQKMVLPCSEDLEVVQRTEALDPLVLGACLLGQQ